MNSQSPMRNGTYSRPFGNQTQKPSRSFASPSMQNQIVHNQTAVQTSHRQPGQFLHHTNDYEINNEYHQDGHVEEIYDDSISDAYESVMATQRMGTAMIGSPKPFKPQQQHTVQNITVQPPPLPPSNVSVSAMSHLEAMLESENNVKSIGSASVENELRNPDIKLDRNAGDHMLDEYRDDFEKFKCMNLLDEDSKNELFLHLPYFVDSAAFAIKLETLYMTKYKDLIQKFNLEPYVRVWCVGLVYHSMDKFLKFINDTQSVTTDIISLKTKLFKFKVLKLKNRKRTTEDHEEPTDNYKKSKSNTGSEKQSVADNCKHPFDMSDLFMKKKQVFEIGRMYKYLMPMSFAMYHAQTKIGTIIKYGASKDAKESFIGGDVRFTIPVLNQVSVRKLKFSINDLIIHTNFKKYIELVYSKSIEYSSLSSQLDGLTTNLTTLESKTGTIDVNCLAIAIINNFNMFVLNNNQFKVRAFPKGVMTLTFAEWNAPEYKGEPTTEQIDKLKDYYKSQGMELVEDSENE